MGWLSQIPAHAQELPLDLNKAIRALYDEKKRLDRLIESLERVRARGAELSQPGVHARRGRKKMTAAERLEVSQRMKRYWAARRQRPAPEPEEQAPVPVTPDPAP